MVACDLGQCLPQVCMDVRACLVCVPTHRANTAPLSAWACGARLAATTTASGVAADHSTGGIRASSASARAMHQLMAAWLLTWQTRLSECRRARAARLGTPPPPRLSLAKSRGPAPHRASRARRRMRQGPPGRLDSPQGCTTGRLDSELRRGTTVHIRKPLRHRAPARPQPAQARHARPRPPPAHRRSVPHVRGRDQPP